MDKIQVLYFLEDRAHERFIKAMVTRIAQEESMPVDSLNHDIRSARRGSRSLIEFKKFIRDIGKTESFAVDIIIVTRDGNCKGHNQCIKQLEKMIKPDHPFKKSVVFAVPDPHIERWYIMDQKAFKEGVGAAKAPELPAYKCKKDYYKQLLRQT